MKPIHIALLPALLGFAQAADLSFAHEGTEEDRKRLANLEGTATPPALAVEKWMNSDPLTLEKLKGKVVILDFWATWCGPCIASIPHNNEMVKKYGDKVVFIGICHPRGAEKMADVVKTHGITYPVAVDTAQTTDNAYGVDGYPDYYIIDQQGKLVVADCANAQVEAVVDKLLE